MLLHPMMLPMMLMIDLINWVESLLSPPSPSSPPFLQSLSTRCGSDAWKTLSYSFMFIIIRCSPRTLSLCQSMLSSITGNLKTAPLETMKIYNEITVTINTTSTIKILLILTSTFFHQGVQCHCECSQRRECTSFNEVSTIMTNENNQKTIKINSDHSTKCPK